MRGEGGAHARLLAPQRAHERGVLGRKVRPVGHRLLVDRRADALAQARRLRPRAGGDDLVAADDGRVARGEEASRQAFDRVVRRAATGVDPGRPAQIEGGAIVQDVAGQGEEHRPGGGSERDLGGPAHDAGRSARRVTSTDHLQSGDAISTRGPERSAR